MLDRVGRIITAKLFDGSTYIKDDRGQSHKIRFKKSQREIYTPREKRRIRNIHIAMLGVGLLSILSFAGVLLSLLLPMFLPMTPAGFDFVGLLLWPMMFLPLLMCAVSMFHVFVIPPWKWKPTIRTRRLAAGRCPACTYELGQSPPRTENLVTCPECGAAWQWPE